MGIDRIGKPPAPPAPPAPPTPSSSAPPERAGAFSIRPGSPSSVAEGSPARPPGAASSAAAPIAAASVTPASGSLDAVRAGAMPVREYLDLKVEEATAHLSGLPPDQLQSIRAALRDRVASDPALAELFRTATGAVPPSEDD